eukprot:CAMPEP_0119028328 /NCGR_PEP_ID=MMETSP1176-20130426/38686_1 /TAXON_ID=265551 /ORGANISM="Synedropsis recta cf, Strain CCMP1620" /LENGTH=568 /DNA_ID=CAMNT_0006984445 /DNA_START=259 /DNA_END=1965 /DNA_ORIENTATION=+
MKLSAFKLNWCSESSSSGDAYNSSSVPGLSYDYLLNEETDVFGSLKERVCVCGCSKEDARNNLTQVICSFDTSRRRVAKVCILKNAFFYTSEQNVPFVLAACKMEDQFEGIFRHASSGYWNGHRANKYAYDHVNGNFRIGNLAAKCSENGGCRVPSSFDWGGDDGTTQKSSANGWVPTTTDDWVGMSAIPRSPELGDARAAYLNAGDCNVKVLNGTILSNPWHCKAAWATWQVWSLLAEHNPQSVLGIAAFNSKDAKLFEFAGGRGFYESRHQVGGWYEALNAAGAGYESKFQYGSKMFMQHKKSKPTISVKLTGRLPLAITNANPWHSPIWQWLGPKTDKPSQIFDDYRSEMEDVVVQGLDRSDLHPILQLQKMCPDNIRLVLPTKEVARKGALVFLDADVARWSQSQTWEPRIIPKLVYVIQRPALGSTISTKSCKRCLTNIDELVETLAEELGFVVVVVHLNEEVPQLHQIYLFLVAQLIVAMHGGAWGSALVTSVGQAAVEVLPKMQNINADHIVSAGGAVYDSSLCLTCLDSKSLTGEADIPDVLFKAKKALCVAIKRRRMDS